MKMSARSTMGRDVGLMVMAVAVIWSVARWASRPVVPVSEGAGQPTPTIVHGPDPGVAGLGARERAEAVERAWRRWEGSPQSLALETTADRERQAIEDYQANVEAAAAADNLALREIMQRHTGPDGPDLPAILEEVDEMQHAFPFAVMDGMLAVKAEYPGVPNSEFAEKEVRP